MDNLLKESYLLFIVITFIHLAELRNVSSDLTPVENQLMNFARNNKKASVLTSSYGTPVDEMSDTLTVGEYGPTLMQDTTFFDIIQSFNRERIPERVVHGKGAGAFGYFEVTKDITHLTKAQVFSKVGLKTDVSARFSQVGGEMGSADTTRDVRGFSVKFHTGEGTWDLVGNHLPIFFVRDAIRFPELIHSQRRNPQTHLHDNNMYWDFATRRPETTYLIMYVNTGLGIPASYRQMNGYGIHAFTFVNASGNSTFVRFHWKTHQGIANMTNEQAYLLAGTQPDYYIQDLFDAIDKREFPKWTLYIQLWKENVSSHSTLNPFDSTKEWPEAEFPLMPVGDLVLNRNHENYFVDIEQLGFCPNRLVPGIEPSPDKLLQGRLFAYSDTQLYRLGVNNQRLSVNRAYNKVANYDRDGYARYGKNQGSAPNYYPNSFNGPQPSPRGQMTGYNVNGYIGRYDTVDEDNFSQPKALWMRLNSEEKQFMISNLASALRRTYPMIQNKAIENFYQVNEEMGRMLARSLNTTVPS